ncbi:TadE/TadG family type IV pilus assembly protein [Rhizobium aouanii]|uniref:TadE/TadG family type IV pilus assembly protein n=1 Tax=Rhizobium aouanii TaxID=3118145 RepID=A0ABU8CJJ6_9HYPH
MSTSFLHPCLRRMLGDRGGNFGIMTAIIAVPLMLAAGLAVDFSVARVEKTNLQQIADGAALAGAKVFDGTNLADAKAAAQKYVSAYGGNIAFDATPDGRILKVTLNDQVDTAFMKIANINTVDVGVTSAAISPEKPTKVIFKPTQAQGYWYKKISLMVVRPNSTAEQVLGTIIYQPTTLNDSGQGTMTVTPSSGEIDLGNYTKLVLKMEIKDDYCGTGYTGSVSNNSKKTVTCTAVDEKKNKTLWQQKSVYTSTLRTDNPDQIDYLFVDGKQLKKGATYPLESYFGCSKTQSHAWEDGGGWERQDFFYTVSAVCGGSEGDFVRLTQ